jgi:hypothetical protein
MKTIRKNSVLVLWIFYILNFIPFLLIADNMDAVNDLPDYPLDIYLQKIVPDTTSILEYDGIKLVIPPGAIDREVTIEIIKLKSTFPIKDTIANVTEGAVVYRFGPSGIRFNRNIKVSIPFNKTLLDSETALSNLFTYFYDEENNNWERLPRVEIDQENAVVVSLTDHFTDMINGTLKMPESPGPVNFDINSIKNLEAANPSDRVMNLKGLTPDSTGAASFQIPLNMPPGRGSAYPILSLSYNSESPNSWMGRGFDISVPSITTDTRFGLPKYGVDENGDAAETDTYILGGEELVLTASSGSGKIYSPRVEKEFKRIVRTQNSGEDYWEVTDKNGIVQTFGTEEGWIGPDRTSHAKTYTWYLTKETDANGNFVSYVYDYDIENKYTYLKEIQYSGNDNVSTSDSVPYKIIFNTSSLRPDRRIDSRGTFISKLVKRLDEIRISYNSEIFRSYTFGYETNEFGQTVLNRFTELDGSGNEFYTYGFGYNKLDDIRDSGDNLIGYNGFGTDPVDWGNLSDDTFPGLNQTGTFGVGASLYLGLTVKMLKYSKWFNWNWNTIASLGVRGGVNFSGTIANSTLLDINGDGLSDAVWKEGGILQGYRNTGYGFDTSTSNDIALSGLPGLLNSSYQKGFSLGASANIGSVGGSVTWQNNWTEGLTAFNDINGDGFIDFVNSDDDQFYMNNLTGFTPADYTTNVNIEVTQSENFTEKEEDYKRTYYIQEPVRKWKAFSSGNIEVSQVVGFVNEDHNADPLDPVNAVTYPETGYSASSITVSSGYPSDTVSRNMSVENGDEIFFHMDAGNDSLGDDIKWDINIAYTDINYFENLNEASIIKPKESYTVSLPDIRLEYLYTAVLIYDDPGYHYDYVLKQPNWKDFLDQNAVDAIIEHSLFVPGRIPEDVFTEIFNRASITEIQSYEGGGVFPGGQAALIDAYLYRPEFEDFIRINSGADETIIETLILAELDISELQSLFYYNDFTDSNLYPDESVGIKSFSKVAPVISIIPEIHAIEENLSLGSELFDGKIFLDNIYNETGTEVIETLHLVPDEGSLVLVSTNDQGSDIVSGSTVSESAVEISASFFRNGIKHNFSLTNPESVLTSLPLAIYNGEVLNEVTSSYNFSYFPSYTSLSITDYDTMYGTIDVLDDKDFFEAVYDRYPEIPDIEEYILKDPMSTEELDHLNAILPGVDLPANYISLPFSDYTAAYNTASVEDRAFLEEVYSRLPEIPSLERYDLASDISSLDETRLVLIFDSLSDNTDSMLDSPLFLSGNTESVGIIALSETEYLDYLN